MTNQESSQAEISQKASHEEVARRAEELWRQNGCPQGRDDEFWFEAEKQLSGTAGSLSSDPQAATAPTTQPEVSGGLGGQQLGLENPVEGGTSSAQPSSRDAELMKTPAPRSGSGKSRSRGSKSGGK